MEMVEKWLQFSFIKWKIIGSDRDRTNMLFFELTAQNLLCLNSEYFTNARSLSGVIYRHAMEKYI